MERIFQEKDKESKPKPKIITIRITDLEIKMFLLWLMEAKGPISEFTRRLWKTTAEWEEFQEIEDKEWLRKEIEK